MDCSTLIRIMQKITGLVTLQKQSTVFSTKMKYLQRWTFTEASLLCGGRSWRTLCVCWDLSQCALSSLSQSDKVDTFWRREWRVAPLWGFSTWCWFLFLYMYIFLYMFYSFLYIYIHLYIFIYLYFILLTKCLVNGCSGKCAHIHIMVLLRNNVVARMPLYILWCYWGIV